MAQTYVFAQTVQDLVNQAVAETIGATASTITALQNKSLIRQADIINRRFVNEAHTKHHFGGWTWLERENNFQTISDTTLNGALTTASITATLTSASGWPTATGRFWVRTSKGSIDFVDFTSRASNTVSGVTNINIPHASGERAGITYGAASDFGKMKRLLVNTVEYFYDDRRSLLPYWGSYKMRGAFIVLPQATTATADCTYWYEKMPTQLNTSTASTDNTTTDLSKTLDIPDDFFPYAVERLKAYIFTIRRMPDLAEGCLERAEEEIQYALAYDCNETHGSGLRSNY